MTFELLLLVGLGAAIASFLKGRPLQGLVALALVGAGAAAAFAFESALTTIIVMPLVAVAALVLAWAPAEPGTYWHRRNAVDANGRRLIDAEPRSRRSARAVVGAVLGTLPGALLIAGVAVVDAMLTGDQSSIAFLAIPLAFFGMIAGAIIGHGWVPRRARQDGSDRLRV